MRVILVKEDGTVWEGDMPEQSDAKTAEEMLENLVKFEDQEDIKKRLGWYEALPGGTIYPLPSD